MSSETITRAIEKLVAVHKGGAPIANLGDAAPGNEADIFAIQRGVLKALGGTIGGWKCATPPGKPTNFGIMAASGARQSGGRWGVANTRPIGLETEVAFRLKRDLPPRSSAYSREDVLDAVDAAFPLLELVQSRYADHKIVAPAEGMADNIAHLGYVVGADVADWRRFDLPNLAVRQSYAGAVQVDQKGGNPSGDPVLPLVWIANHLHGLGEHLRAGQVVTTGTYTGCIFVPPGQRVQAGFAGFGEITFDLT
ncbi:MAG: 2-keto-4-pentenoate hydratase [Alphaproteobacteria bacterium]|jgi:2-keto-4-pentenoate hydratase